MALVFFGLWLRAVKLMQFFFPKCRPLYGADKEELLIFDIINDANRGQKLSCIKITTQGHCSRLFLSAKSFVLIFLLPTAAASRSPQS